jgi:hypothetical protein
MTILLTFEIAHVAERDVSLVIFLALTSPTHIVLDISALDMPETIGDTNLDIS